MKVNHGDLVITSIHSGNEEYIVKLDYKTVKELILNTNIRKKITKMKEELTQQDSDNLADIIWYIKGRLSVQDYEDRSDLCSDHVESLRKFRNAFSEYINEKK